MFAGRAVPNEISEWENCTKLLIKFTIASSVRNEYMKRHKKQKYFYLSISPVLLRFAIEYNF